MNRAAPVEKGRDKISKKLISSFLLAALLAVTVACACAGAAEIPAGNTGWTWSNPLPQGNTLDRLEASGGRIWAGGATGTLLHSDDGGSDWVAVRTGLLDDIRTIEVISPNSIVFAGRCALRRSDDGGITVHRLAWGSSDDTCAAQIQDVSFPTPLIGYLLLTNGDVYATSDGGGSWNKRSVAPGTTTLGGNALIHDLAFNTPSSGVLSVGNQVMQTVDAGVSWTPVATVAGGTGLFNFEFVDPANGFAVGQHSDLLKTSDGGATWTVVAGDFATRAQDLRSLSCGSMSTCIATIATGNTLLRTGDGGKSWAAVSASSDPVHAAGFVSATRAVAVGSAGSTSISSDGGATWSDVNSVAAGEFRGIRADSSKAALIFGEQGALARSNDGGESWRAIDAPTKATIVDATTVGARSIYVLDKTGRLRRSRDAGKSWKRVATGGHGKPRALHAWTSSRLAIVGPRGVRLSTHAGARSRAVRGPVARLALNSIDRAGSALFAYGRSKIALSKDKGRSWKVVRRPHRVRTIARLDMVSAKVGYLLDSKAELFSTRTGGRKWTRVETTAANVAVSMAFGDHKHGYMTDNSGRMLATTDGGATWLRQYPFYDAKGASKSLVAASGRRTALTLVIGTNRVFRTTSNGRIGNASRLTIRSSATRVRKGTVVRVTGELSPASGSERVAVLARVVNAKGGTRWVPQERTVSAAGTFTTSWRITRSTEFIARWSGDAAHDGDAARRVVVKLRK